MDYNYSNFSIKSEDEEDTRLTDNDSACMFLGYEDTDTKSHELFELLKSWDQLELFEYFSNQRIDLEVLSVIKPHHFDRLLEQFDLRTHIMFEHNLQQWRDSIGLPLPKYTVPSSSFGPHRYRRNFMPRSFNHINVSSPRGSPKLLSSVQETQIIPPNDNVSATGTTETKVTLDKILKTSIKGKMLMDIYKKNKKFEESQRTLLIHLIAEYFNDKGMHLELSATYNIEKEIIAKFPSEQLEFYRTSKRGRIYNKYCNHKYSLIKVARSSMSKDVSSTATATNEAEAVTILVPEEDAEEHISLLKKGNLSIDQFETSWKACTRFRINEVRKHSLPSIFTKWPQYKSPNGYKYIAMDFKYLEPNWNSLMSNWDTVYEKLFKFLSTGQSIKTLEIRSVLSNLKNNISKDCRDAGLLWCLHGYLKPTLTICATDDKGKKTLSKISIKASQDSFIYVANSFKDIERHRQVLYQQYDSVDPFIAVLGTDIMNFTKIFVCIEDIKYSLDNFISALDLCYNIIVLFRLEYPTACKPIWSFIQNMFFETKPKTNFPRVHILINELRDE